MKLPKWLIILILICLVVLALFYIDKFRKKKAIFGRNYSVVKTIYSDDTERDFHENGFSVSIDSITEDDARFFSNPPKEFFGKYPSENLHSDNYEIHLWKKTPFLQQDSLNLSFALNLSLNDSDSYVFKNRQEVLRTLRTISNNIKKPGNLYSFEFRTGLDGIDLFFIDIQGRKIYKVNRQ